MKKIPKHITEHLRTEPALYEPTPIRVRIKRGKRILGRLSSHCIPERVAKAILGKTILGLRSPDLGIRVFHSEYDNIGFQPWWLPKGTFSVIKNK